MSPAGTVGGLPQEGGGGLPEEEAPFGSWGPAPAAGQPRHRREPQVTGRRQTGSLDTHTHTPLASACTHQALSRKSGAGVTSKLVGVSVPPGATATW